MATQGSISPFAKVVFHLKSKSRVSVTPFDLAIAKSGPHATRIVSVIVVVVAVRIDNEEVIVVVIRGTQPPPHRRGHINRDTPNFFEVKFSIFRLHF